jgi:hypothetical protein
MVLYQLQKFSDVDRNERVLTDTDEMDAVATVRLKVLEGKCKGPLSALRIRSLLT